MIEIGKKYKHFKGGIYKAVMLVRHSETEEEMVVYQSPETGSWVRPVSMWEEIVDENGTKRFTLIED